MFDALDLTATGSGYYRVWVDGVQVSQHTTEREATERAVERKLAVPGAVVSYDHDYIVRVDVDMNRLLEAVGAVVDYPTRLVVGTVNIVGETPPLAISTTYQYGAELLSAPRPVSDPASPPQRTVIAGRTVVWSSSNEAVATVDQAGLATAVGAGSCTIFAECEGVTGSAALIVEASAPTVVTVTIAPATFSVFEGATIQLTATPKDASGNVIPGLTATWGTSNGAVATVNANGLVTGVAAGTATITGTINTVDGTAAATVAVQPTAGTPITFATPELAFMLGPLLAAGDGIVTGASTTLAAHPWPYFDKVWNERGTTHYTNYPRYYPQQLAGTVAITNNTATVTGTGTNFLTSIDPNWPVETLYGDANYWGQIFIKDAGGIWRGPFYAASVASDLSFTLTANWTFGDVTGVLITTNSPTLGSGSRQGDLASDRQYYDMMFSLYQRAFAANDATMLAGARRVADSWVSQPIINNGYSTDVGVAPRSLAFCGMIVRALELDAAFQTHALWDYLVRWTDARWAVWLGPRLANTNLYYGVRDGSYTLLATAYLARVLPNSYTNSTGGTTTTGAATRATYRQRARDACVDYYCRIQGTAPDLSAGPPGLFRWDDNDETPQARSQSTCFQLGLAGEALITTHRLLVDTSWPTASDITTIASAITKLCEALYEADSGSVASWTFPAFRQGPITNLPPHKWRGFWYQYYGGVVGNLTRDMPDSKNQLAAARAGDETNDIRDQRQNNSLNISMYGYAYYLTGDPKFLQYGDDLASAAYGRGQGVGSDPYWGLHDYVAKSFNQNYRNTAKYFAWRSGTPL